MKRYHMVIALTCALSCLLLTGCKKRYGGVWDETKTARSLKGDGSGPFWGENDSVAANDDHINSQEEDFIPLKDEDLKSQFSDVAVPSAKFSPGEEGSGLPGIEQFRAPSAALAGIFRTLYFNTDDYMLRGKDSLAAVDKIAAYLKDHPKMYIFIEGHCDERAPEAYNLSLGARRANYVRSLLVKKGVDLNQIHTISYGKEKPVDMRGTPEAWSKNRRAQFKIYERS